MKSVQVFVFSLALALLSTGCQSKQKGNSRALDSEGMPGAKVVSQDDDTPEKESVPEWKARLSADSFSYVLFSMASAEYDVENRRSYLSRQEHPGEIELARLDLESAMKRLDEAQQKFSASKSELMALVEKMEKDNQLDSVAYMKNFISASESWFSKVRRSSAPSETASLMRNQPHY